jgi:hypothetical protein
MTLRKGEHAEGTPSEPPGVMQDIRADIQSVGDSDHEQWMYAETTPLDFSLT